MGWCDRARRCTTLSRLVATLLFTIIALTSPRTGAAGTALNQLCGAANLGSGCIGAFQMPKTPTPATRVGGGAFGGMGGAIMGMFLEQALSSALDSGIDAGAAAAAQAQAAAAQQQVQALQETVRLQQKLQEERESRFVSQLLDRPASGILGGSQDLGILEAARAEAGSPFDGNDPHSSWTTVHDAWFSPDATGLRSGSSPLPIGEGPVAANLRPIDCMGKLCAFPTGSAYAPIVETASTGASSQPGVSGFSPSGPRVAIEWRQVGNRVVWAARRDWMDSMESARQLEITAQILGSGSAQWADYTALSGQPLQQAVAREGRDIYQRVMEALIAETFGVISLAVSGRFQEAIEQSATSGERVREAIRIEFKMARVFQSGDREGAGQVAGDEFLDHAKEVAKERAKDILDILPASGPVKEGIGYIYDAVGDHWLQQIGNK